MDSQSTQTKEQADSSTQRSSEAANTGKETPNDQTENADLAKVQAEATGTRDDRVEPSEQQVQLEESQERKRKREDPVQGKSFPLEYQNHRIDLMSHFVYRINS